MCVGNLNGFDSMFDNAKQQLSDNNAFDDSGNGNRPSISVGNANNVYEQICLPNVKGFLDQHKAQLI